MDNNSRPLQVAANNGHFESTKLLLSLGSQVNAITDFGSSALSFACDDNYFNIVKMLLENGADPNNTAMCRPIHIACTQNAEILQILLDYKADPNARSISGITALHRVAEHGPLECVKLLIKSGANLNAVTPLGNVSPLLYAENYEIIKELVDSGADVNIADVQGHTAIFQCLSNVPCEKTLILLIQYGADVEAETITGIRPLFAASQNGYIWAVKVLLQAHADPNPGIRHKPLFIACYFGYVECVKLLLDFGADVHAKNELGNQPLYAAAGNGHTEVVKLLLEYGADPNNFDERSPLDVACEFGYEDIVQVLIENYANIGRSFVLPENNSIIWQSPMYTAARYNKPKIIEILHKAGCSLDGRGLDDSQNVMWSPLYIASSKGYYDSVLKLLELGAQRNIVSVTFKSPLSISIEKRYLHITKLLLESGANPNMCMPIFNIVHNASFPFLREILKFKVNLDVLDVSGRTPLLIAIAYNYGRIASLLLSHGASPNIADNDYVSPLFLASKMRQTVTVRSLLKCGANPNVRTVHGFTPLHIAADLGFTKIVSLLLQHGAESNLVPWASQVKAIDLAKSAGHRKIVSILEDHK
jgi:ankyrin repeat protein